MAVASFGKEGNCGIALHGGHGSARHGHSSHGPTRSYMACLLPDRPVVAETWDGPERRPSSECMEGMVMVGMVGMQHYGPTAG